MDTGAVKRVDGPIIHFYLYTCKCYNHVGRGLLCGEMESAESHETIILNFVQIILVDEEKMTGL